jgi:hypothetical protein
MFNYGYMCYQAERAKTQAEQRDADAQLGQLFAEIAQLRHTSIKAVYEVAARFWPVSSQWACPRDVDRPPSRWVADTGGSRGG